MTRYLAAFLCVTSLPACAGEMNQRMQHRIRFLNKQLDRAERDVNALARTRAALAQRQARLQTQLRHNRQQYRRLQQTLAAANRRYRSVSRALQQCRAGRKGPVSVVSPDPKLKARPRPAPRPVVSINDTRVWGGTVTVAVGKVLGRHLQGMKACYSRHGRRGGKAVNTSVWVTYRLTAKGIRKLRVARRSPSSKASPAGAPALERCVLQLLRRRGWPRPKRTWRVAQLFVFSPSYAAYNRLRHPRFRWPWKLPARMHAGPGQVCAVYHSRFRYLKTAPNPFVARPCRPGLKCCYPCGVQGCNHVCRRNCGPPRP